MWTGSPGTQTALQPAVWGQDALHLRVCVCTALRSGHSSSLMRVVPSCIANETDTLCYTVHSLSAGEERHTGVQCLSHNHFFEVGHFSSVLFSVFTLRYC